MNKKIFLTLIMSFVLTINCLAQIVCYTTTSLNVRKGPSTKYQIIGTIPVNTEVTISGENYKDFEWLQVNYNGQAGYINTKYLSTQKTESPIKNTTTYNWNANKQAYNYVNSNNAKYYNYYINCNREKIQRPTYYSNTPHNATAICRDGSYSFSTHRRGTCSYHGGVQVWL